MNIKEINHTRKKTGGGELQQYLHFKSRGFAIQGKKRQRILFPQEKT